MPSLREIMLNRAKEPAKARAQLCQRCHPSNLLCSSCLFSHWVQHLFQLQHIMYRFLPCKTAQEHSYSICCWMKKHEHIIFQYVLQCLQNCDLCRSVASIFSTGSSHGPGAANSIDSSWHSKGSNARGDAAEEWLWTPSTARNLVTGCFRNSLPKKFKESMNLVRITSDLSWFTVLEIIFLGFNFLLTHPSSSAISTFDQGPKRPEDTKPAQEAQGQWSPEGHEERTRRNQHLWVKSAEEWVAPGILG